MEKLEPHIWLVSMQNGILNILLSFDPAIKLLGIYPRETKTDVHPKTHANIHNSLKLEKNPKCP